jgi:hypothetical protein
VLRTSRIRTEAIAAAAFGAGVLAGRLSPPTFWLDALVVLVTVVCLIVALSPSLAVKAEDAWAEMPWIKGRRARKRANLIAYRATGLTKIAVDLAMKVWVQVAVAGHTTKEQEAHVKAAYGEYQNVMRELRSFLLAHDYNPTPDDWSVFTTGITPRLASIIQELLKKNATPS